MTAPVLAFRISGELTNRKLGPPSEIAEVNWDEVVFKDAAGQGDYFRRKTFRQRVNASLMLLLVTPAVIYLTKSYILKIPHSKNLGDICVVLSAWIVLSALSLKITKWIAVQKFGEAEKREQEQRAKMIKEKTAARKKSNK